VCFLKCGRLIFIDKTTTTTGMAVPSHFIQCCVLVSCGILYRYGNNLMTFFHAFSSQGLSWMTEHWMKSTTYDWNESLVYSASNNYVMKYCHSWLSFGWETHLVSSIFRKSIISKSFYKGWQTMLGLRLVFGDTTTRVVYNECWARQIELVTLHTIFSVALFYWKGWNLRMWTWDLHE
jgi:hypothetical protein